MAANSLNSSSEALPASDSDMSADESQYGLKPESHDGNRIASLHQENRVLKMELEMFKLRTKSLQEENKALRQASVSIVSIALLPLVSFALFLTCFPSYASNRKWPNLLPRTLEVRCTRN